MLKSITLFVRRNEIWKLLELQKEWILPKIELDYKIRRIYLTVKLTFLSIGPLHCLNAIAIEFVNRSDSFPFDFIRPRWMNEPCFLLVWHVLAIQSVTLPIMAMDILFMTILRLTQIQFRQLHIEMRKMFDNDTNEKKRKAIKCEEKLRLCIIQHKTLLE